MACALKTVSDQVVKLIVPNYILPILIAITVGMGTWVKTISTDVIILKEKQPRLVKLIKKSETLDVMLQDVKLDLTRITARLVAIQDSQRESVVTLRRELQLMRELIEK